MAEQSAAKPSRLRRIVLIIAALVLVLLLIVVLLPTLLSTGAGRGFVVGRINAAIPGRVEINSLSLGWFSGQRASGINLFDPEGQPVVANASAYARDLSLLALLRGSHDLGTIVVRVDEVIYEQLADGSNNFTKSLVAQPAEESDEPGETDWRTAVVLVAGRITLRAPDMDPVALTDVDGLLAVADTRNLKLKLTSGIAQGGDRGSIALEAAARQASADAAWSVNATAELVGIPVVAIDRLLNAGDQLVIVLGSKLDATVAIKGDAGELQADISARTEQATIETHLVTVDQSLRTTDEATRIHLLVTPAAYEKLMAARGRDVTATLVTPVELDITLNDLHVPRTDGRLDLAAARIDGKATISDVEVDSDRLGRVALRDVSLPIRATRLGDELIAELTLTAERDGQQGALTSVAKVGGLVDDQGAISADRATADITGTLTALPLAAIDEILQLDDLMTDSAGAEVTGEYTLAVAPDAAGRMAGSVSVNASSDRMTIDLAGDIADDVFTAKAGSYVTLTASPALVERFMPASPVQLADHAELRMDVGSLSAPLREFALGKVRAAITVRSPRVALGGHERYVGLVLRDLVVQMPDGLLGETVKLTSTAALYDGDTPAGGAVVTVNLASLTGRPISGVVTATLTEVTTLTADRILGTRGELVALAGERVDQAEAALTLGGDPRSWRISINDEQLVGHVSGQRDSTGATTLDPSSTLSATVQPADFARWQARFAKADGDAPRDTLRLLEPVKLRVSIAEARYAAGEAQGAMIDPARTALFVDVEADTIMLERGAGDTAQRLAFRDVNIQVDARKPTQTIIARLTRGELATADAATGEWQPRKLEADTRITGLFDDAGQMRSFGEATVLSNLAVEALPLEFVEQLLGLEGRLSGILGLLADVSAAGAYPGEVNLALHSDMADFAVKGVIDETGMLRLSEDVIATVAGSEELAETLLKWGSPVLVDLSESEKALRMHIPAKDFAFPLRDFDAKRIVIKDAKLEIGTVLLEDSWLLKAISPQLAKLGAALGHSGGGKVRTTFTPMTVNVANGIATSSDLWMMTDHMIVGVKGPVDLVNRTARLTIGIEGQTLTHNLSFMRDVVKPKAVYEVSVAGPINALKPDMGAFFGQIAALKGRLELQRAGGDWGALGGAVLDGLLKDSKLTPATGGWPNQPPLLLGAEPESQDQSAAPDADADTDTAQTQTPPPTEDSAPAAADETTTDEPEPAPDPVRDILGEILRRQLGGDEQPEEEPTQQEPSSESKPRTKKEKK